MNLLESSAYTLSTHCHPIIYYNCYIISCDFVRKKGKAAIFQCRVSYKEVRNARLLQNIKTCFELNCMNQSTFLFNFYHLASNAIN